MTRRRMPVERQSITLKFRIRSGGKDQEDSKGYLTVGFYEDGTVGEIFVKMDKQGDAVSGFIDAWAISVSMLLQTGTTLEEICTKFKGMAFEPSGWTDDKDIGYARSPIDYIARYLEKRWVTGSSPESQACPHCPRSRLKDLQELEHTINDPEGGLRCSVCLALLCSRCGSTEGMVALHKGVPTCDPCRSGKAVGA